MSKNNKGKIISLRSTPLSPEKYVKTQARSLPVYECLITEGWQGKGICNIMVTRRHSNGNSTVGFYLVDLYCLGLKNTYYEFSLFPEKYKDLRQFYSELVQCDYATAHNIIYGAIAYAEDYGFKPHKDFAGTQFILENDDDDVELMDIEFGYQGKPFYVQGPNEDTAKANHIRNTLAHAAGEGNFHYLHELAAEPDYNGVPTEDDEGFDEDDFDLPENWDDAANSPIITLQHVSKVYDKLVRTKATKENIKNAFIGNNCTITRDSVDNEYNKFDNDEQEKEYYDLSELIVSQKLKKAIKGLKEAIVKYPDKPIFYNLLQTAYIVNGQDSDSDKMIWDIHEKFPDYLFAKVAFANVLLDAGKPEYVLAVFNGKPDLNYLYPQRKVFHATEASAYYGTMCRYFTAVDNIDSADFYMNAVVEHDLIDMPNQTVVLKAIVELCTAKLIKLRNVM